MSRAYIRKVATIASTPRLIFGYRNALLENLHISNSVTILPISSLPITQLEGAKLLIDSRGSSTKPYLGICKKI